MFRLTDRSIGLEFREQKKKEMFLSFVWTRGDLYQDVFLFWVLRPLVENVRLIVLDLALFDGVSSFLGREGFRTWLTQKNESFLVVFVNHCNQLEGTNGAWGRTLYFFLLLEERYINSRRDISRRLLFWVLRPLIEKCMFDSSIQVVLVLELFDGFPSFL